MVHSRRYVLSSELRDTYLVCVTNSSIQAVHISDQENGKKQADPIGQSEVRGNNFDATNTRTALTQQIGRLIQRDGFVVGMLRVSTGIVINVHLFNERHDDRAEGEAHESDQLCREEEKRTYGKNRKREKYGCQEMEKSKIKLPTQSYLMGLRPDLPRLEVPRRTKSVCLRNQPLMELR